MVAKHQDLPEEPPRSGGRPRRIETQIHRRKKAKAVGPLQAEWEAESGRRPDGLRMPEDRMGRRRNPA